MSYIFRCADKYYEYVYMFFLFHFIFALGINFEEIKLESISISKQTESNIFVKRWQYKVFHKDDERFPKPFIFFSFYFTNSS